MKTTLTQSAAEFQMNFRYAFRPHKPRLLIRLAGAVLKSAVLRRPPLRYVDFAVDFDCNLRCQHCFATSLLSPERRRMTVSDYERVARACMDMGTVNFSFQGGEPLLFDGLEAIIHACQPERNLISVTTNGTLVTPDKAKQLKNMGVDILTVSLDSANAAEHDSFRGVKGTFDKTLAGIRAALSHGLNVTLGAVVTHETLQSEGIRGLVRLAEELRVLMYFILPVRAGKWIDHKEIMLTADDLAYINRMTRQSSFLRTDFQANLGPYGCGAVKEILYLTPYGDVLACPFMHISLGNIFEEPVSQIRARALKKPYFANYHQSCLVSTDADFIATYLSKTFTAKSLPVPWREVFGEAPTDHGKPDAQ